MLRIAVIFLQVGLINKQTINDMNRILARSAVLDDILLGLHGNQQRYEGKADEIMEKLKEILEKLNQE